MCNVEGESGILGLTMHQSTTGSILPLLIMLSSLTDAMGGFNVSSCLHGG